MPVHFSTDLQPPANALIVCAGTVTCNSVNQMGAGFSTFIKYFEEGKSLIEPYETWQLALEDRLKDYHSKTKPMPYYMRIAEHEGYIGGIATVPPADAPTGLGFTIERDDTSRKNAFKTSYHIAVSQAILDAMNLGRPLYIQPLGIGVYGWDPKIAAKIFAETIAMRADKTLEITIPIFDTTPNSNDCLFRDTLITELNNQEARLQSEPFDDQRTPLIGQDAPEVEAPERLQANDGDKDSPKRILDREEEAPLENRRQSSQASTQQTFSPESIEPVKAVVRPKATNRLSQVGMLVLNTFIGALGIAAIALAFTLLNAASLGIPGLVLAGIGAVSLITGSTLFAVGLRQKSSVPKPEVEPVSDSKPAFEA